jgi:hypothetical protein
LTIAGGAYPLAGGSSSPEAVAGLAQEIARALERAVTERTPALEPRGVSSCADEAGTGRDGSSTGEAQGKAGGR